MPFHKWRVTVLIEGGKGLMLLKRYCELPRDIDPNVLDYENIDITLPKKMSFIQAFSLYLKLSMMDLYCTIYKP